MIQYIAQTGHVTFYINKLLQVVNQFNNLINRGMAQLVARLSGGQEAVSSSLATPTNKNTMV